MRHITQPDGRPPCGRCHGRGLSSRFRSCSTMPPARPATSMRSSAPVATFCAETWREIVSALMLNSMFNVAQVLERGWPSAATQASLRTAWNLQPNGDNRQRIYGRVRMFRTRHQYARGLSRFQSSRLGVPPIGARRACASTRSLRAASRAGRRYVQAALWRTRSTLPDGARRRDGLGRPCCSWFPMRAFLCSRAEHRGRWWAERLVMRSR